jgi:hypothetical protein
VAASGAGAVIERLLDERTLKLGGWAETDRYSTDELMQLGFDGLRLPGEGEVTFQIFYPEKLILPNGSVSSDPLTPPVELRGRRPAPGAQELAQRIAELQAGEETQVDTSKKFWLIASSDADIVAIIDNAPDAKLYFETMASAGEWLWEYADGITTQRPCCNEEWPNDAPRAISKPSSNSKKRHKQLQKVVYSMEAPIRAPRLRPVRARYRVTRRTDVRGKDKMNP